MMSEHLVHDGKNMITRTQRGLRVRDRENNEEVKRYSETVGCHQGQ